MTTKKVFPDPGTAWTAYLVDASWDFGMTTKKVFQMT